MFTKIISSFDEYIDFTEKFRGKYYFRGQADASWEITPALLRPNCPITSLSDERAIIADNIPKESSRYDLMRMPTQLATLFKLQHYGTRTRICDLTISNLCALLFASIDNEDSDGAVFVINAESAVEANGLEMQIFAKVLTGEHDVKPLQSEFDASTDVQDILTRNYVVRHKDMLFSNNRSFRQGGTGIVFGFGYDDGKLSLLGSLDVDAFVSHKIIIPKHVKKETVNSLRKLGYTKDILHETTCGYQFEDLSLIQEEFSARKGMGLKGINYKVEGKYRVSTLYFDPGVLAMQISKLYRNLFSQYGNDAQIWTFYYFDNNDLANINWICRGQWDEHVGYKLIWNKDYRMRRLHSMNNEVASNDVVSMAESLVDEVMPYYEMLREYGEKADYEFAELLNLVSTIHSDLSEINRKASDIPLSDYDTNKYVEKAQLFVWDVHGIGEHTIMHSKYTNQADSSKKWSLNWNFQQCQESFASYIDAKNSRYKR